MTSEETEAEAVDSSFVKVVVTPVNTLPSLTVNTTRVQLQILTVSDIPQDGLHHEVPHRLPLAWTASDVDVDRLNTRESELYFFSVTLYFFPSRCISFPSPLTWKQVI